MRSRASGCEHGDGQFPCESCCPTLCDVSTGCLPLHCPLPRAAEGALASRLELLEREWLSACLWEASLQKPWGPVLIANPEARENMWLTWGSGLGSLDPRIVADFFHQHPQTPRHPPPAPEPQGTQAQPAGLSHPQACFSVVLRTEGLVCVFMHVCMYLCVPTFVCVCLPAFLAHVLFPRRTALGGRGNLQSCGGPVATPPIMSGCSTPEAFPGGRWGLRRRRFLVGNRAGLPNRQQGTNVPQTTGVIVLEQRGR